MKSGRIDGRYIAIALVALIALICLWALIVWLRPPVSFADASGIVPDEVSRLELSLTGDPNRLDGEQAGALLQRLDALELRGGRRSDALTDCYARIYAVLDEGRRVEILLAPDGMLINPLGSGRSRLYSFDGSALESFVRSLGR